LDIRTPSIDNILNNYKSRLRLQSKTNVNENQDDVVVSSIVDATAINDISNQDISSNNDKSIAVDATTINDISNQDISSNNDKSIVFNQLPVSKQSHIVFNDSNNTKLLKSIQKRYQLMTSKLKHKDDNNVKDIAKKYMQLANINDINSIISMMSNDAVCYGNVGIDNVEKGMIAFHRSLNHPYWKINDINIITKDQLQCIDNFRSSHICHRNDLKHIEVKFTRYWTVDSIVEIANAVEIISVDNDHKIVSIMYSQLPVKAESHINNKYPDEYNSIELNKNDDVNIVSDDDSNSNSQIHEWYEYFDEGVPYYYNVLTNESSWDVPNGANINVYKQYQDDDGNWYFLCNETGVSLWVE
jgi:hypothetical protein